MPILFMIVASLFAGSLTAIATPPASPPKLASEARWNFYPMLSLKGLARAGYCGELIKAVADGKGLSIRISTDPWEGFLKVNPGSIMAGQF